MPHTNNKEVESWKDRVYRLPTNTDGDIVLTVSEMFNFIHQELQKARDEEWEKVHRMVDNILAVSIDYHMDSVVLARDIENIAKKYFPIKDYSELDLPINSIFKE